MKRPTVPAKLAQITQSSFPMAVLELGALAQDSDLTLGVLTAFITSTTEHSWGEQVNDLLDSVLLVMWEKGRKTDGELVTVLSMLEVWLSDAANPMLFGELDFDNSFFATVPGQMSAHNRVSAALYVLDLGRRRLARGKARLGGHLVMSESYAMIAHHFLSDDYGPFKVDEFGVDARTARVGAFKVSLNAVAHVMSGTSDLRLTDLIGSLELTFDLRVPEHDELEEPDKVPA